MRMLEMVIEAKDIVTSILIEYYLSDRVEEAGLEEDEIMAVTTL